MEERRLILAFALSFAVLMGFRMWTNSRYPQPPATENAAAPLAPTTPSVAERPVAAPPAASTPAMTAPAVPQAPLVTGEEKRVEVVARGTEIAFSSRGARLLSWKLLEYKDPRGKPVEAHPGGNPVPGPLDLVTGRNEIDARIRGALFRATDIVEGNERGARFEFSDGTLVVNKTFRTIKDGRAFRLEAEVKENGVPIPVRLFWGPGFGQPSEEEKSLQGYLPPQVVEIDASGVEHRLPPTGLTEPRDSRAQIVGVENK